MSIKEFANGVDNMEDRYLFKAKCFEKWHTGNIVKESDGLYIRDIKKNVMAYIDDESTICQCTGLKDKKGKLIWENDICNYYNPEDKDGIGIIKNGYVLWIDGTISMRHKMTPLFYLQCKDEWEVIGNVFDNPELLESEG